MTAITTTSVSAVILRTCADVTVSTMTSVSTVRLRSWTDVTASTTISVPIAILCRYLGVLFFNASSKLSRIRVSPSS